MSIKSATLVALLPLSILAQDLELEPPTSEGSPFLRIQLEDLKSSLQISSEDTLRVYGNAPLTDTTPVLAKTANKLVLSVCATGACLNGDGLDFAGTGPIWLKSDRGQLRIGNNIYRGWVEIKRSKERLKLVQWTDVESYVRSVLPQEVAKIPKSAEQLQKAFSIMIRTFAHSKRNKLADFDVSANETGRKYLGISAETKEANSLALSTQNQILTYAGIPITPVVQVNSGGYLASALDAWGDPKYPYLVSKPDESQPGQSWAKNSNTYSWSKNWTWAEFENVVRLNKYKTPGVPAKVYSEVSGIKVTQKSKDGRVQKLELTTNTGVVRYSGVVFTQFAQDAKGKLPSTKFQITKFGANGVQILGNGIGDGVGLCLAGAVQRAHAGQKAEAILNFYYPGTVLETRTKILD